MSFCFYYGTIQSCQNNILLKWCHFCNRLATPCLASVLKHFYSPSWFHPVIRYCEGSKKHLDDPFPNSDFLVLHCLGIRSSVSGIGSYRIGKNMSKIELIPSLLCLHPSLAFGSKAGAPSRLRFWEGFVGKYLTIVKVKTLAYYGTELMAAVKSFKAQVPCFVNSNKWKKEITY